MKLYLQFYGGPEQTLTEELGTTIVNNHHTGVTGTLITRTDVGDA